MSVPAVFRQVRSLLGGSADAPQLAEVLSIVDSFVAECFASAEQDVLLHNLDDELQAIHHELVDHSSFGQTEIFLSVLYHFRSVLSSASIIITWFDLVLRPALREPKLPTAAVNHAKDLIICALEGTENSDRVPEFRRRLLDLYLFDASGDDVLDRHFALAARPGRLLVDRAVPEPSDARTEEAGAPQTNEAGNTAPRTATGEAKVSKIVAFLNEA